MKQKKRKHGHGYYIILSINESLSTVRKTSQCNNHFFVETNNVIDNNGGVK